MKERRKVREGEGREVKERRKEGEGRKEGRKQSTSSICMIIRSFINRKLVMTARMNLGWEGIYI